LLMTKANDFPAQTTRAQATRRRSTWVATSRSFTPARRP
jgi:hypothetical protein